MASVVYDLVIVGSGMFGSAAAYHASQISGKSICLIGPPEPKNREDREVFGSWYDEGRICCQIGNTPTWAALAVRSMRRYRQLEKESGVSFYNEVGYVSVLKTTEEREEAMLSVQKDDGVKVHDVSDTWRTHFPFFNLPDEAHVLWEKNTSGHISPRKLIEAHQMVAVKNGVEILREVVLTIIPAKSSQSTTHRWDVVTEEGTHLHAKSVLVCAGAYAGFKQLFEHVTPKRLPNLELRTQTVAYLRISSKEAERLRLMPTLVVEFDFDNLDGAYILPPILYPDGKWYLKLGHGRMYEEVKRTLPEVTQWFRLQSGIPECVEKLAEFMCHILPGLEVKAVTGDGCITAHTPDYQPYVDLVEDGFAVALGGNGYGAQSCSEIGRIAARLVLLEEWDSDIPRDTVRIKWKEMSSGSSD
ncbi:monomeric sarcosine oxidase-like [Palaemon carinicauda]|uniref:monomeric sarcosine oxidase-like n=1 Tax=Palaemon carinicauda TaxID=392227 RepID=UPI0035B573CA